MKTPIEGVPVNARSRRKFPARLIVLAVSLIAVFASFEWVHAAAPPGQVVAWGTVTLPYVEPGTVFTNIGAGWQFGLAVNSRGELVPWGRNLELTAIVPPGVSNVIAAAGGEQHTMVLTSDGQVLAWGKNSYGQTNIPPGTTNVIGIAAAVAQSFAIKADGSIVGWGWNGKGQLNVPAGLTNVIAIAAGYDCTFALRADGTVAGWGAGTYGRTNFASTLSNVIQISTLDAHCIALKADGTVVAWGNNGFGQTNVPPGLSNVVAVVAGGLHSVALKSDGTVVCWGANYFNQCSPPAGLNNVVAIASGYEFSIALKGDGTMVAWGADGFGERFAPGTLHDFKAIAAGQHIMGLKTDGVVVQLARYNTLPPIGLSNVVAIVSGGIHDMAIKDDGTIVAWGNNASGDLNIPPDLTNVVAAAIGWFYFFHQHDYSVALRSDGSVAGWGGRTVDPSVTNVVAVSPAAALKADGTAVYYDGTPVSSVSNAIAIATHPGGDALALIDDGTVHAWAALYQPPPGLSNVVAIAAGQAHSLALRSDGTIVGWGNANGAETPPPGLRNVSAIAAGHAPSVGGLSMAIVSPLAISSTARNGQNLEVQFHTFVGSKYALEYTTNLFPALWLPAQGPATDGTGGIVTITDTNAVDSASEKFYRLKQSFSE